MRILLPHASFEVFGGAERVVSQLANYLTNRGNKVSILTYRCPESVYMNLVGCEITTGSYNKLKEYIHTHYREFDIVNSHNHPMELLLYPKKMPHVWSYNEAPYYVQSGDPLNPIEKNIVESSVSVAVVANQKNANMYKSLYNTEVINNMYGIDVDFYSAGQKSDIREKYNINKHDYLISIVAWVHPNKRQRNVIPYFYEVLKNIPNAKLLLAGTKDPNESAYITSLAKQKNMGDRVIFTGHVDNDEVRDIYYSSNIILCPFGPQGSYLTTLESLCTKKPVIVSMDSMISEDLVSNGAGIVTNDYTQAIMDVYTGSIKPNYDLWYKWASQFTVDRYCRNMYAVFEGVIGG